MRMLLKAFRKHYLRTKDVYVEMANTGVFTYHSKVEQIAADETIVQADLEMPDQSLTVRFVVLMRRFLNPQDRLYYKTIWSILREQFAEELSDETVSTVDDMIEELNGKHIKITYNGEDLTPEDIYNKLAEGSYFHRDERSRIFLEGLAAIPMIGPFFWFQFYDYTVGGLAIASKLFDVIQVVETTEKYRHLYEDGASITNHCIYCLTTTGKFTTEEHMIPEAMGNYDEVLPRGYVCDACNNGVLSTLDQELSESMIFAWQRVGAVPYTKQGKLPEMHFDGAVLKKIGPLDILLQAEPGSDAIKLERELENGQVEFSFHAASKRKFDQRKLARALCKIGLGMVARDLGQDFACSSRYDAVREFILRGTDFRNNLLLCTDFTLSGSIRSMYQVLDHGTPTMFTIFGVILVVNLEEQPVLEPNSDLVRANFIQLPLCGQSESIELSMRMVPHHNWQHQEN